MLDLEVYLMRRTSELKCENPKILTSLIMCRPVYFIGTKQFASMRKFMTLHCCNVVCLQHGGGNYCRQNDVIVIPCIFYQHRCRRHLVGRVCCSSAAWQKICRISPLEIQQRLWRIGVLTFTRYFAALFVRIKRPYNMATRCTLS